MAVVKAVEGAGREKGTCAVFELLSLQGERGGRSRNKGCALENTILQLNFAPPSLTD